MVEPLGRGLKCDLGAVLMVPMPEEIRLQLLAVRNTHAIRALRSVVSSPVGHVPATRPQPSLVKLLKVSLVVWCKKLSLALARLVLLYEGLSVKT